MTNEINRPSMARAVARYSVIFLETQMVTTKQLVTDSPIHCCGGSPADPGILGLSQCPRSNKSGSNRSQIGICDHNRPVPIGSKSVPAAGSQFYQMHMRVDLSIWSQLVSDLPRI